MPEVNAIKEEVRDKKFLQALVANGGVIKEAYKAISPNVTEGTARSSGSEYLARLTKSNKYDIGQVLKDIGGTPDIVLNEALKRATKSKGCRDYLDTARLLAKVGGWGDQKSSLNINLNDNTLEVVDIVRVRLKQKRKNDAVDANIIEATAQ